MEVALIIEMTQIAGGDLFGSQFVAAEIAQHGTAAHHNFAVAGDGDLTVGQGAADAAELVSIRSVERHHGATLREAITFIYRQSELAGMFDQVGGHLAATDGNKAQALELLGQRRGAGAERQQQAQQFGHQHQTVGRPA